MSKNPFEVTKAVDFTDEQIAATWVDLPGGGFANLADPRSPMPRFLVGGKGGGRTHLLRYFSYPLQRLRHKSNLIEGIRRDGYVGIYFRCGGLNSSRFAEKRQDESTWAAIFSYYTEVWLGRLTVDLIADLLTVASLELGSADISSFVKAVVGLFDRDMPLLSNNGNPLLALADTFHSIQKQLDIAINNVALTHHLNVDIGASPGRLVFGIPAAASLHLRELSGLVFAYLLDEFENLTLDQQRYINTLIREKQLPTTFLVGSRLYGLRTQETLSAGEENRQGSEYDLVILEDTYRSGAHHYGKFCSEIVRRRLREAGSDGGHSASLAEYFERPLGSLEERACENTRQKVPSGVPRPWLERLEQQLRTSGFAGDLPVLLARVQFSASPLHEKFAIFLLYRAWADGADLVEASTKNRASVERLLAGAKNVGKLETAYKHYRHDLYAQLLAELKLPQEYYGFNEFVRMSGYLPRNLLVVLKQITRWSLFLAENPFRGEKISLKAQREGVREASTWFLSDAKSLGRVGEGAQLAIRRLASLFREMRFSDKPVEVACSAFATDRQGLSPSATRLLDEAVSHSLILEVPIGRRDKNNRILLHKYQLNPMLGPLFDLSLALRGPANLSAADLNVIFDPGASDSSFSSMRRKVLARMDAPFRIDSTQEGLFE
ncbi:MAG TPA: hypothetical protein VGS07_02330 [Thermoanaerobaculia bacterium]|jgi:hypothetical protein|nr:hypothetical protein [Thermoanaerobaculia bacterium]